MKNWKMAVAGILAMVMIGGCTVKHTPPTIVEERIEAKKADSRVACYQALAMREQATAMAMSGVPADQKIFLVLMKQQGDTAKTMLALATKQTLDECGEGTNVNDVLIAEMRSNTELQKQWLSAGKWAIGLGAGAWIAHDFIGALDSGGDVITSLSGGSKLNQNSQNTGSFNTAGNDVVTSAGTNINDQSAKAYGDGDAGIAVDESCPSGDCEDGVDGDGIAGIESTEQELCIKNPPGGFSPNGTPMWSDTLSCKTRWPLVAEPY